MNSYEITEDLSVCLDCAGMIANGELGTGDENADREHAEKMVAVWGEGTDGVLGLVLNSDDEGHFSWRRCDGCGSSLGGDRIGAVHMARVNA
jgi:hypothetical protein